MLHLSLFDLDTPARLDVNTFTHIELNTLNTVWCNFINASWFGYSDAIRLNTFFYTLSFKYCSPWMWRSSIKIIWCKIIQIVFSPVGRMMQTDSNNFPPVCRIIQNVSNSKWFKKFYINLPKSFPPVGRLMSNYSNIFLPERWMDTLPLLVMQWN